MNTLRSRIIRLAHQHPQMRHHLLSILKEAAWHEHNEFQKDATPEDLAWAAEKGLPVEDDADWGKVVPVKHLMPGPPGAIYGFPRLKDQKMFVMAEMPIAPIRRTQYSVPLVGLRKKTMKFDTDPAEVVWDFRTKEFSVSAGHTRLCAAVVRGETTATVKLFQWGIDKEFEFATQATVPSFVQVKEKVRRTRSPR